MDLSLLGFVTLGIVEVTAVIWAIVDAASRPRSAWKRAGQSKTFWVALEPLGLVFLIGLVIPAVYFIFIRPSVRRAEAVIRGAASSRSDQNGYQPQPGYWYQQPAQPPAPPPGWYPDGAGRMRYWSGSGWTEHVQ